MKKFLSLLLLSFSLTVHAQTVDDLVFLTEDYPPSNFERDGKLQGIAVDTLVEIMKLTGSKKTREDIKLWPWARAYDTALKEKNTVLFVATRTEARENLFKWVGPIVPSRIVLLAKKSKGLKVKSIDELNASNYKIGAVREDIGEQSALKHGIKKEKIVQTNSGATLAKLLQADRIDMAAYGNIQALWNLKEQGHPTGDYEELYLLTESQQYFIVQKDTDDKVVAKLQAALDQLKASGKLNEIINRYR